ncbi:MAG TPA: site-2 protease family protein [Kofleriaceae bacterium]|nr:site-2 protease family protein [Kofleriaceae bacterium]
MASAQASGSWWVWDLGRIRGIAIRVHLTLLLLLAWFVVAAVLGGAGLRGSVYVLLLVVCVFATIVVHELGHALVARRFGIRTRDIMLLPIGGIASLERMPAKPSQELAVALVGPAINLVLAAILAVVPGMFALRLAYINVGLAVFNLIPAFPMDGGRALRALLALRTSNERATDIAATCGKVFAVLLCFVGLFFNPLLVLIAFVVWMGASQERALVHLKSALSGVPVSAAMLRRVETVTPEESVEDAASILLGGQTEVPVIDHGQPVGALTRDDVANALSSAGPSTRVATAHQHAIVTVDPSDPLDGVLDRLRTSPGAVAVVVDHGTPVGLVTAESLAAYAEMHQRTSA